MSSVRQTCLLYVCVFCHGSWFCIWFPLLNVFVALQWVTTWAVMDAGFLCHRFFWSCCSELWKKVKPRELFPTLSFTNIWAYFFNWTFFFSPCIFSLRWRQSRQILRWTRTWFELFLMCSPQVFFSYSSSFVSLFTVVYLIISLNVLYK